MKRLAPAAIVALLLALFAGAMVLEPVTQSPEYHDFADQRYLLGVPNLFNVASNAAFLAVGALGMALCAGRRRNPGGVSWMVFSVCTVLLAFGSAYYHWAPGDGTLFWDRLPLALVVMALFVALMAEHASEWPERFLLALAMALGAASVLWWRYSGDLRPYLWVQFAPLLCIPVMLAMFPARHTHRRFLLYGVGLYGLAKGAEMKDREIFALTSQVVSGHTLKHLLAAGAIFVLLVMLRRRETIDA